MSLDWIVLAAAAVGQIALFVLSVNVTHAIGLSERSMNRVKLILLAALVLGMIGLGWEFASGPWHSWSWAPFAYSVICLMTALVGLPVATLLLAFRKLPAGITARVSTVDLGHELGADTLIGRGRHAWLLRIPGNESFRLQKLEWELAVPNLPSALDGLSIVQVSDLHFAPCFERRFFDHVADQVASWDADLMFFTGDLIDHDTVIDWIEPVMSRLRGRLGSFAILGNHDQLHHPARIRGELEKAGFTDLEGVWQRIRVDNATVAVGGTAFPWGPRPDPLAMPQADYGILLSHSPDRFFWGSKWGLDLILSGHNHGGQVRVPVLGPIFMPSLYSRRFDRGFFRSARTLMYVNQGVAGKHPIRYGCPPEVTRLVLRVGTSPATAATSRRHGVKSDALPG